MIKRKRTLILLALVLILTGCNTNKKENTDAKTDTKQTVERKEESKVEQKNAKEKIDTTKGSKKEDPVKAKAVEKKATEQTVKKQEVKTSVEQKKQSNVNKEAQPIAKKDTNTKTVVKQETKPAVKQEVIKKTSTKPAIKETPKPVKQEVKKVIKKQEPVKQVSKPVTRNTKSISKPVVKNVSNPVVKNTKNVSSTATKKTTRTPEKYVYIKNKDNLDEYLLYANKNANVYKDKGLTKILTSFRAGEKLQVFKNAGDKVSEVYSHALEIGGYMKSDDLSVEKVYSNIDSYVRKYNAFIKSWAAKNNYGSEYDKALRVNNFIINNYSYADSNMDKHLVFLDTRVPAHKGVAFISNREGVCGAYAEIYNDLLNAIGVKTYYVEGFARGTNHAWNVVRINGKYYFVDPTWNDVPGHTKQYFLRGSNYFGKNHDLSNTPVKVSKTDYGR